MSTDAGDLDTAKTIVFQPKSARPPPPNTVGVVGWLRENLFYSIPSTVFTVAGIALIYTAVSYLWEWGVSNAVWEAANRRECLNQNPDGACWAGVGAWFNSYMYGRFPDEEQWRINGAFLILGLRPCRSYPRRSSR